MTYITISLFSLGMLMIVVMLFQMRKVEGSVTIPFILAIILLLSSVVCMYINDKQKSLEDSKKLEEKCLGLQGKIVKYESEKYYSVNLKMMTTDINYYCMKPDGTLTD